MHLVDPMIRGTSTNNNRDTQRRSFLVLEYLLSPYKLMVMKHVHKGLRKSSHKDLCHISIVSIVSDHVVYVSMTV